MDLKTGMVDDPGGAVKGAWNKNLGRPDCLGNRTYSLIHLSLDWVLEICVRMEVFKTPISSQSTKYMYFTMSDTVPICWFDCLPDGTTHWETPFKVKKNKIEENVKGPNLRVILDIFLILSKKGQEKCFVLLWRRNSWEIGRVAELVDAQRSGRCGL